MESKKMTKKVEECESLETVLAQNQEELGKLVLSHQEEELSIQKRIRCFKDAMNQVKTAESRISQLVNENRYLSEQASQLETLSLQLEEREKSIKDSTELISQSLATILQMQEREKSIKEMFDLAVCSVTDLREENNGLIQNVQQLQEDLAYQRAQNEQLQEELAYQRTQNKQLLGLIGDISPKFAALGAFLVEKK